MMEGKAVDARKHDFSRPYHQKELLKLKYSTSNSDPALLIEKNTIKSNATMGSEGLKMTRVAPASLSSLDKLSG
jgi:hypothetical protein